MTTRQHLRDLLTAAIQAVTDTGDEPLDEVHDIPQIVNAVMAVLAEHEPASEQGTN